MQKIKIVLATPELITEFISICSKYDCDINVYDESTVLDGKSIVGIFTIAQGKEIEVQAITSDESVISSFIEDMKKFAV